MEAKKYLSRVHSIERIIANKKAELDKWQALATSFGCISEGERVQSSGSKQRMQDAVLKCVEIEEDIKAQIVRLQAIIKEVNAVIEQLPPIEYDLIHKVYIQNYSLSQVAQINRKSYSWATTTQNRAFKIVETLIKKEI